LPGRLHVVGHDDIDPGTAGTPEPSIGADNARSLGRENAAPNGGYDAFF